MIEMKSYFALGFLLVLYAICNVSAQWDEEVTVEVGSNYELDCEASDDEFVLWYKTEHGQDNELVFSERIFFPTYDSVELKNMVIDDAGVYKCKSTGMSGDSGDTLKTFKITVKDNRKPEKVKPPQWTRLPDPNSIMDGSRLIVLPCKASGVGVKVKAFKILKDGRRKLLRDSGVVLHRPKASDSGKFVCKASNEAATLTHEFELLVRVNGRFSPWSMWSKCSAECGSGLQNRSRTCTNPKPENGGQPCYGMKEQRQTCNGRKNCESPKLTKFGYEITDKELILSCVGKGVPTPTVEWKYRGRKLPARYNPMSYKTTIPKRQARSGSYSCTIRNKSGYFSMYLTIDV